MLQIENEGKFIEIFAKLEATYFCKLNCKIVSLKNLIRVFVVMLCVVFASLTGIAQTQYYVASQHSLPDPNTSYSAFDMNDSGQIVTQYAIPNLLQIAKLNETGTWQNLTTTNSAVNNFRISNDGQIIAERRIDHPDYPENPNNRVPQAVKIVNGQIQELPFTGESNNICYTSVATAISQNGTAVGSQTCYYYENLLNRRTMDVATVFNNSTPAELISPFRSNPNNGSEWIYEARALGVNDSGVVVGEYTSIDPSVSPSPRRHAFIWNSTSGFSRLSNILSPPTSFGYLASATNINNEGHIIGKLGNGDYFYWDGNEFTKITSPHIDPNIPPFTLNLNEKNQVLIVGNKSVLWDKADGAVDISTLVPDNSGLTFVAAYRVNNKSEILCLGIDNTATPKVFVLKPKKEPLIFVPGTMGSELYRRNVNGTTGEKYFMRTLNSHLYNRYLTLNPNSIFYVQQGFIPKDVTRTLNFEGALPIIGPDLIPISTPPFFDIYEPLLKDLRERGGFREYDVSQFPPALGGCDEAQISTNPDQNPNLFVFPYDWRLDNDTESADRLREFIQTCVSRFYPDTKVNILSHSQGGLVASRYIFNNPQHNVNKLITIATPFLGAPKAVVGLEEGGDWFGGLAAGNLNDLKFFITVISPEEIKFLAESFPSMHQLLPSRHYFSVAPHQEFPNLLGGPTIEELNDANNNGQSRERYTYDQLVTLLDNDFPRTTPGTTGKLFHDPNEEGIDQDDWRNENSGVRFHHIIATQRALETVTSMTVENVFLCGGTNEELPCDYVKRFHTFKGLGDGTVPTVSASRFGYRLNESNILQQVNLNSPNATRWYRNSTNESEDFDFEHNGVHQDRRTQDLILALLKLGPLPSGYDPTYEDPPPQNLLAQENRKKKDKKSGVETTVPNVSQTSNTRPESYYFDIVGISELYLRDEENNFTGRAGGIFINQAKGVSYDVVGSKAVSLTLSTSHSYKIRFQTGSSPLLLTVAKGVGNRAPNRKTVFRDIVLPQGVNAKIEITPQGVGNLRYDADGDGTFESEVLPTTDVTGANAKDITPPTANINFVQQGNTATVTITGQDNISGVKGILYSLNGTNFTRYTAPFTVNSNQTPITVYALADDNAGNRSELFRKNFVFQQNLAVRPVLECVVANPDGTFIAKFGYKNDNANAVTIPVGANNKFSPNPQGRGQTTNFQTGRIRFAFEVPFNGNNLVWSLRGPDNSNRTSTASRNSARCQ